MRRISLIKTSVLVSTLFGLSVVVDNIRLSGQTATPKADGFEAGVGTHETRAQPGSSFQLPNGNEHSAEPEQESPPQPTRTSFMATWHRVTGATGYLLDVSVSSSFNSFLDGYHDLDVGHVEGRMVTGLSRGTTYYYRVRPYYQTKPGRYSETAMAVTVATTGLTIQPAFDSSIINHPNSAAIQATINQAISIYETLFSDPITIQIRFRYSTTQPNGDPMPAGQIAQSNYVYYAIPWDTYINALRADATSGNDDVANASLPGSALSTNLRPSSAGGRAVGLNTPPAMFADGTVGNGGPYDGIVTLNSSAAYQFTRPPDGGNFDGQRAFEHEMDEIIGLGSRLNLSGNDLRPQDLFSWSSAGNRNITTSGARYFSIDGGITNIVGFNQRQNGDLGDWLSEDCPQANPYVQNAFTCQGQFSDIAATTPEGINLDVVGYDLVAPHPPFFTGEVSLGNGVYYLQFPNGTPFGYYAYLSDPHFIYHFDMGYEYWFDANDGHNGIFFYDFAANTFFYTSPSFPFPYFYDFTRHTVLYYFPDPNNPGYYTTNPRYFYNFATHQIITM
jgi:hypothetical protein